MNNHPSDELKLMILEYQTVFIQNINMRHGTAVSSHNPRHTKMLKDIWDAAKVQKLDVPGAKKWKKIGFTVKMISLENSHVYSANNAWKCIV